MPDRVGRINGQTHFDSKYSASAPYRAATNGGIVIKFNNNYMYSLSAGIKAAAAAAAGCH